MQIIVEKLYITKLIRNLIYLYINTKYAAVKCTLQNAHSLYIRISEKIYFQNITFQTIMRLPIYVIFTYITHCIYEYISSDDRLFAPEVLSSYITCA